MNGSVISDLRKGHGPRLIMLALGIMFLLFPGSTQKTIALIVAGVFVVLGIMKIVSYFAKPTKTIDGYMEYQSKSVIVIGIIYIVLAALVSKLLLAIIPVILGLIIVVNGVIKLQYALELKKDYGGSSYKFMLISSIVMIALGVIVIANPFKANNLIIRIIGGLLVFNSVTDLTVSMKKY